MQTIHPQDRPADQPFQRSFVEVYRGHRLRVAKSREWGHLEASINDWNGGRSIGHTNGDAARQLHALRSYVDDAHDRPGNYTNGFGDYTFA